MFTLYPAKILMSNLYMYMIYVIIFFSELKRRLKAEQKAKEKLEKDANAQKKQAAVKKETVVSDATKSADISPNVKIINININIF